jgi:thioredoxin reductase (NADPH)
VANPAIVLISADHADVLEEQFWRYTREYDVRVARSAEEAGLLVRQLQEEAVDVCLFVERAPRSSRSSTPG